jgi:large subunit ribosomal protein L10
MRPEKANIVSDLAEKLNRSPFLLVADYQRMNVDQFGELRSRLAPAGAEVRVVKNSFLKRAMADSGMPDVADKLTGQTAIVMGENDVAPVAKILKLFAAEFKIATLKIGVVDKAVLSTSDVEALAELPAREVLLAQLLGLLLAPATRLVRVLNEPASAFARLLKAKGEKKEASEAVAAAPGPEAPAPVSSAEETPEAKQESPVAETKEETPAAESTPEVATEAPAAESPTGETATETPA